jgi:Domain of unknown function (DUF4440)
MCCTVLKNTLALFYQLGKMDTRVYILVFLLLCLSTCTHLQAQDKSTEDTLYRQIAQMDSILFNAFNNRDIKTFGKMFSEELEFYHDKGGLTNYQHTIEFMENTAKNNNGLRRELVPGSLEVYPVKDYGAIEIGTHRFCHLENGRQDCGSFKFVHLWKRTGNEWKLTRVISYGH